MKKGKCEVSTVHLVYCLLYKREGERRKIHIVRWDENSAGRRSQKLMRWAVMGLGDPSEGAFLTFGNMLMVHILSI